LSAILLATRRTLAVFGALALIATAGVCAVAGAAPLTVSTGAPTGRPIPADFLGLSLEYRAMPALAGPDLQSINPVLVALLRHLVPHGHPVLRIGGQSSDRTWWPVPGAHQPLGITYSLTPRWITSVRALAQATNARLILGVGLEADQPKLDAVEADQLLRGLGRKYVAALEIGNEPELYTVIPWYLRRNGVPVPWYSHVGVPVFSRPPGYGPSAFYGEFSRVLAVLPPVPIAGPATGLPLLLDGFRRFVAPASRVRIVTWHAYGLNQCVTDPSSPQYPTVSNLLSLPVSRGLVNGILPDVVHAHRVGATVRVAEMNSVTCNGRPGVSNTMASALWVMDALFTVAAAGVDGVNIHTFPNAANGLFDFSQSHGHWVGTIRPLYYGVTMFAQAAPPGSRLLTIDSASQDPVRQWATLAPDHRIRVLLINDSLTSSARTLVRPPSAPGPAKIERLRASSAYATGGVTLGGESFGTETRFGSQTSTGLLAAPKPQSVTPRAGAYAVTMPAASAALLTLPGRATADRRRR
jgi:hypothetical protein